MCEDCERGDTLAVVYSRKVDRRGWRPPAKAANPPRSADAETARGKDVPPRFACERTRRSNRRSEIG
jgi:hypothetical protein